jgi:hypothetical protein
MDVFFAAIVSISFYAFFDSLPLARKDAIKQLSENYVLFTVTWGAKG